MTERKPVPIGVVIGPLSATRFSRTDASVDSGSGVPSASITSTPACRTSHSNGTPVASSTRRVASVSSGPVPSPGISVTRWATRAIIRRVRAMTLAEAAAQADELAAQGAERELADLRKQWDEEVEASARSADYRVRAQAYRAIGQFRFKQKLELLKRGLEDESPACRGSALISLELLSRDQPARSTRSGRSCTISWPPTRTTRSGASRVVCLKNGSPQADTIVLLEGIAGDDEADPDLRTSARKVAELLRRRAKAR